MLFGKQNSADKRPKCDAACVCEPRLVGDIDREMGRRVIDASFDPQAALVCYPVKDFIMKLRLVASLDKPPALTSPVEDLQVLK